MQDDDIDVSETEDGAGGRKGPMTREEEQRLWDAYLVPGKQPSYLQLARDFDRNRETIAKHLSGPAFEAYRDLQLDTMRKRATHKLARGVEQASDHWLEASANAAEKGDHRPAKELLIATGVIAQDAPSHLSQVQVIVGMPGRPALADPFYCDPFAMTYDAESDGYLMPEKASQPDGAPTVR